MTWSDVAALFSFTVSPWEIVIRGSSIYWFLYLLFRLVLRRDVGSIGIADMLLVVMIADAAQNGMSGEYKSITEGFLLVGVMAAWNYIMDLACYHSKFLQRVLEPRPLLLVKDGQLQRRNMRQELITQDELSAKLREQGVHDINDVQRAYMESSGEISVLKKGA